MANHQKTLSPFAEAALHLDADFSELHQLSGQLERLSLESDSGLERGKKILAQFGECGERISDRLQNLATTLNEARQGAEKSTVLIASRAHLVQERQNVHDQMTERFTAISAMVQKLNELFVQLKKQQGTELTQEEKSYLKQKLPELEIQMKALSDEAIKLKQDAHNANMKTIERNADSLSQTLTSARKKLSAALETGIEALPKTSSYVSAPLN